MMVMMMVMVIMMPKALADFIFDQCELGSGRECSDRDDREAVGEAAGQRAVSVGFASRFEAWCKKEGRPAVSLDGQLWASALPTAAEFFPAVRVRVVYGGAWVTAGDARGGGGGGDSSRGRLEEGSGGGMTEGLCEQAAWRARRAGGAASAPKGCTASPRRRGTPSRPPRPSSTCASSCRCRCCSSSS